ncbi:MAG: LamB/YcsF family protein, partial [Sulfurimonadaceae bacterium]|nr:LamB/YcsF family protein [Sulfurimonadaceae bacterium]
GLLAKEIALWFKENGVSEVLTQHDSELDRACRKLGITIIEEAFLDRTYILDNGVLKLAPRKRPDALICDPETALKQYRCLKRGFVEADGQDVALTAKTLCVHSDSEASLEILKKLRHV